MEHPIGPGEMKRDVEGGGSIATCRICFDCDVDEEDDLISPCMCKGTVQFVHRSCLDHWRSVKEGFAFSHCNTCKAQFHFRVNESGENSWRKMKFRLFVARDIFIVFLALQTVIGVMGGLVYLADKHGYLRYLFDDLISPNHPIPICYCIGKFFPFVRKDFRFGNCVIPHGAFVFFALLGFFGIIRECYIYNNHQRMERCQLCCSRCTDCRGGGMMGLSHKSSSGSYPKFTTFGLVIVITMSIFAAFGVVFALLAATMVIQRIWQRHYHILAKRSLTQEYVMEDLHGCYTPAKLDPKHEERLKKLKLF